jgi:Domain of unknown function (DUF6754)
VNLNDLFSSSSLAWAGLGFVLLFLILILIYTAVTRRRPGKVLREIPAFGNLRRAVGLSVEAGKRIHLSLGWGSFNGLQAASALLGLSVLQRIARAASISDRPPVATSGEGTLTILSQDSLRGVYRSLGAISQFDPYSAQLTGVSPFSYAAGVMPVVLDQQVAANVLAGHFGGEVALITDAGERSGSPTLAGSDNIPGQAVLYAAAQDPLIGEELYAAGAYLQAGPVHIASLRAQDFLRWIIIVLILVGALLKFLGVL